jgi:ParB family transcriptional regulator, chromosome partitioning protein
MAEQTRQIPIEQFEPRPDQPRKEFGPDGLLNLGKNLLAAGQLAPLIVYFVASVGRYILVDGERRWRAAKLVGIKTLLAWVLDHEPTALELHRIQMCIAVHTVGLSPMEKSDQLAKIKQENNWSISELAENLNMSQPQVTKLLTFQNSCPDLRDALKSQKIDTDKAYAIASRSDHNVQRELLAKVNDLTREQLRRTAKSEGQPIELRTSIARFALVGDVMVTVQRPRMALSGAIQALSETLRQLKAADAQGLDVVTASRVMRDRAKAAAAK